MRDAAIVFFVSFLKHLLQLNGVLQTTRDNFLELSQKLCKVGGSGRHNFRPSDWTMIHVIAISGPSQFLSSAHIS